jgi:hypothetical protein
VENPFLALTRAFNRDRLRAIVSSGQAVVLHRLAVMSKDGDWIVREDPADLRWILEELARRGARYRFGAPLDARWLAGGWSAHFEYPDGKVRVRTDFVSRPPRIEPDDLAALWRDVERAPSDVPVVDRRRLILLKRTNREKDYAVIGDLARTLADPRERIRYSRSARDLMDLSRSHRAQFDAEIGGRPALAAAADGEDELAEALDRERRRQIRENERRLAAYLEAASPWRTLWPEIERSIAGKPLLDAHTVVTSRAEGVLPLSVRVDASGSREGPP